jgi:hypothetical protein
MSFFERVKAGLQRALLLGNLMNMGVPCWSMLAVLCPDQPTRPSRQLHQRDHQSDAESAKNAPSKADVLSGNDIDNIIRTETRPKISPLKRPEDRCVMRILEQLSRGTAKSY